VGMIRNWPRCSMGTSCNAIGVWIIRCNGIDGNFTQCHWEVFSR
jgi:hypothetical protein